MVEPISDSSITNCGFVHNAFSIDLLAVSIDYIQLVTYVFFALLFCAFVCCQGFPHYSFHNNRITAEHCPTILEVDESEQKGGLIVLFLEITTVSGIKIGNWGLHSAAAITINNKKLPVTFTIRLQTKTS